MKSLFGGPVRGHVQVEMLSAYLDGQASPAERAFVDAHLQQCGACQAELESLRSTVALLHAMPRVRVPRAFTLSEAQVGIRQPQPVPGWMGGLVRGLGAVAAVLLVAFVAFSVLRPEQALWNPSAQVARVEPTEAIAVTQAANQPTTAAAALEAPPIPTLAGQDAPLAKSGPTATEESASEAATLMAAPTQEPPIAMAAVPAPTEGFTNSSADGSAATAATVAPAPSATDTQPAMIARAASTPEPEMGAAGMTGQGGGAGGTAPAGAGGMGAVGGMGGGAADVPGLPSEHLTPEPTPPALSLATGMPSGLRFAYADLNALWAVDRDGARQLAQGRGINTPQLSPDQQWVAYRVFTDNGIQLWAVRWEGGEPKLLLDDATLPTDKLPAGYVRRAFNDSRWGPGNNILSVTLAVVPDPERPLPPILELWQLNVESGTLKQSSELGRAWRPFYSPNGRQYLTIAYGSEEKPEGALNLVDSANGKATTVLSFPASSGKIAWDGQVAWAPNGAAAWVAIPTADNGQPNPPNGAKLYRVSGGKASEVNEIDAYMVYWSPNADKMAYTRFTSETMATSELYLAEADGSNPELYATMTDGQFIAWSPSGRRFLYQDNYQIFVGEQGQVPVRISNAVSSVGPRWVSDDALMALQNTGEGGLLVLRGVDGEGVSLLPLPQDATWDVNAGR